MYLIDLIKNLFRRANILLSLYLFFTIFIVVGILGSFPYTQNSWINLLVGFIIYVACQFVALSPVGEWILRKQNKCTEVINQPYAQRVHSIFNAIYQRACLIYPRMEKEVKIYVKEGDYSANALATGRRTICITEGMLARSDLEIAAALSHEFGHLAHHDTDIMLFVVFGNIIISAIYTFMYIMGIIITFGVALYQKSGCLLSIGLLINRAIYVATLWLWTAIGMLLVKASCRKQEFDADEFAYNCGLGRELCYVLASPGQSQHMTLWATLQSTHPDSNKRIDHLRQLGARYP